MEQNIAIQLLQLEGEVLVDSRIVAKGIDVEHESFMKTIYTYQTELEEFGVIRFEIGKPPKGSLGGRPEKYAMLNRNQAGVAISFSRNTKEVVRFKVDLFKAIDIMEKRLAISEQQLTEARAMIKTLTDNPQKLPWGLSRAELALEEMTIPHIHRCIDDIHTWLAKPYLTEKQMQKLQDTLAELDKHVTATQATLHEDLAMNRHIDDLFFKMHDMVHPALPEPKH